MLAFSPVSRSHQAIVRIAARTAVGRGKDSPAFCQRTAFTIDKSFECNSLGKKSARPVYVSRKPKQGVMLLSGKRAVATLRRR
jgi:hypothetical protein